MTFYNFIMMPLNAFGIQCQSVFNSRIIGDRVIPDFLSIS